MKYQIRGTTLPILDIQLTEWESVFTEAGWMARKSSNIWINSGMRGWLWSSITRTFSGESLFMTKYSCIKWNWIIAFCNEFPWTIMPINLAESQSIICQKDAFMVAENSVKLKTEFTKKIWIWLFWWEWFFLQKLTWAWQAFLEFSGAITEYQLTEGQSLEVDPWYVAAFEPTINYDITRIKGIKNMLFWWEWIFLAKLTWPGKIWLQSMPLTNLRKKIVGNSTNKRSSSSSKHIGFIIWIIMVILAYIFAL